MSTPLDSDDAALETALSRAGTGGKQFRPRLVHTIHDLLDGRAGGAVAQVADAVELLHTAFLVHDDVIDGDDVRRGRPSAAGAFRSAATRAGASASGADSYALTGAVLTGDLALADALRAVATAPVPPSTVRRLLDLFDHALRVSAAGELADVRLSLGLEEPTMEEVLTMAEHKTAVYSFQLPLQCGAVLADASPEVVAGLGEIGRRVGVAFQLIDDLVGMFGTPEQTGKAAVSDLREGKRTPLIVHARTTAAWTTVRRHLGDPRLTEQDAERVRAALRAGGSHAFVSDLAAEHLAAAARHTVALGLPAGLVERVGDVSGMLREGAA
ncbi:polyprenyl synthetase family protein [Nocardioides houyundeii]|uniref:polyprenyl synthetase family protein n=1 Tax=Nocardioides houyundeii TaxID=2045452 RepID=UPI0013B39D42|nr:polyprenyl synthetase family protein [Nocardioides houyundeii]